MYLFAHSCAEVPPAVLLELSLKLCDLKIEVRIQNSVQRSVMHDNTASIQCSIHLLVCNGAPRMHTGCVTPLDEVRHARLSVHTERGIQDSFGPLLHFRSGKLSEGRTGLLHLALELLFGLGLPNSFVKCETTVFLLNFECPTAGGAASW